MHLKTLLRSSLLLSAIGPFTCLHAQQKPLSLWYKQPAAAWTDALPIGNGRLGAMVFGGVEQERLQLNEATLWSGRPREYARTGAVQYLQPIRQLLAEGWEVELEGKQFRSGGRVEVDVKSGIDWFDVTGRLEFEGASVRLPDLLAAVRRGEDTVVLDDGSVGILSDDVKKKFRWMGVGETHGGDAFPTICGTGTEDYFCGAYNFDVGKEKGGYREFTTPYSGMPLVIRPDGLYESQTRFSLYRWHIADPIRFDEEIKVTIQALGWRKDWFYLPLQDDIASVAYWYQSLPTVPFPQLPGWEHLEAN